MEEEHETEIKDDTSAIQFEAIIPDDDFGICCSWTSDIYKIDGQAFIIEVHQKEANFHARCFIYGKESEAKNFSCQINVKNEAVPNRYVNTVWKF